METNSDSNYRDKLQNVINSTEDHFEQKLTYISAGALGLTLTFIEKIIPLETSIGLTFLIMGWGFLVMTLLLNLCSHMISKVFIMKSRKEYDEISPEGSVMELYNKVNRRNEKIDLINWATIVLLFFGISFIVLFASLNSINKKGNFANQHEAIQKVKNNRDTRQINYTLLIDTTTNINFTIKNK